MIRRPDPGRDLSLAALVLLSLALLLAPACTSTSLKSRATPAADATHRVSKKEELAAAIRGADRIEVRGVADDLSRPPQATITGEDIAGDFLTGVPIDELGGDFRCGCDGSEVLRFLRGDQLLATVSIHHFRSMRWVDGPWDTDVFIAGEAGSNYPQWMSRHHAPYSGMSPMPPGASRGDAPPPDAFAGYFPSEARALLPRGSSSTEGFDARRIASDLPSFVPDEVELVTAACLALGGDPSSWLEDDQKIGVVQNAALETTVAHFIEALEANAANDQFLRGAARLYFRFQLNQRFDAATNAVWLPSLADAALRTVSARNRALVLMYVGVAGDPASWTFLREIATGARTYPWDMPCWFSGDMTAEPSLRASAAVLLALSGAPDAPRLAAAAPGPVFGLDEAATEIARSLVDPTVPIRPAHFKYPSHVLGYAAAEAVARQSPVDISIATAERAFIHRDHWVARRVRQTAETSHVTRHWDGGPLELYMAPVSEMLVSDHPALALEQCTAQLAARQGRDRTTLLVLRGVLHERREDTAAAIADLEEALVTGGYSPVTLHRRLAWLYWQDGRWTEASRHVDAAVREEPSADMLMLRGLAGYIAEDFGPAVELDFSAALALDPRSAYARAFQHLCANLGGRPECSRLHTDFPQPANQPFTIIFSMAPASPGVLAGWEINHVLHLKGTISADELLVRTDAGTEVNRQIQKAEAHFYIAQKARIGGDSATERAHLEQCVAVPLPALIEYQIARARLASMDGR